MGLSDGGGGVRHGEVMGGPVGSGGWGGTGEVSSV